MSDQTLEKLREFDNLPGWLHPDEGRLLYSLVFHQKIRGATVEIGSYKGKSTCYIAQALKDRGGGVIYAIDPHLGETGTGKKSSPSWKEFNNNIKKFGFGNLVKAAKKTSEMAVKGWTTPVSFLNIDGLHDYENVRQDLSLWLPYLVDEGVVVCHDAFGPSYPGVIKAIREYFFGSKEFRGGGVLGSQYFAIKGKPRNILEKYWWLYTQRIILVTCWFWQQPGLPNWIKWLVAGIVFKPFYLNVYSLKSFPRRFFSLATFP